MHGGLSSQKRFRIHWSLFSIYPVLASSRRHRSICFITCGRRPVVNVFSIKMNSANFFFHHRLRFHLIPTYPLHSSIHYISLVFIIQHWIGDDDNYGKESVVAAPWLAGCSSQNNQQRDQPAIDRVNLVGRLAHKVIAAAVIVIKRHQYCRCVCFYIWWDDERRMVNCGVVWRMGMLVLKGGKAAAGDWLAHSDWLPNSLARLILAAQYSRVPKEQNHMRLLRFNSPSIHRCGKPNPPFNL